MLYYLGALGSGFGTARVLIALLRAKFRAGLWLTNKSARAAASEKAGRDYQSASMRHQVALLTGSLVLSAGFIYAVRQQVLAVDYGYKTEGLRREHEKLVDEQRRLFLAVAEVSSPAQSEQGESELEQVPDEELIKLFDLKAIAELGSRGPSKTFPLFGSGSPYSFESSSGSLPWGKLALLTLLGGFIAVITSGLLSRARQESSIVERAPGATLHSVVDFLYSQKTVKETFEPIIADWRFEYFEALSQKRIWKARWICVRYTYSFVMAMGLSKIFSFYKVFTRAGK
jgi:hypothetical protein